MHMLLLNKQVTNLPIMSLQSGGQLGVATETIIDPRKLQIVAFYVDGPRIHKKSILHSVDIREIGPLGFIVDSADNIMELDENLVRLQEIIDFKFTLLGKLVVDDQKKKLGKVAEYSVENGGLYIQKLHVSQSVVKNLTSTNLIIHRSQIVEITDEKIIVRSATIPQAAGLVQALNPFRKSPGTLAPDSARQHLS